jgi:hypothetical protein
MGLKWILVGTSVPLRGCRPQHNIAPSRSQTIFANGERIEESGGRTAAGQQPHVGGHEINALRRRVGNQKRQARCDCHIGGWTMGLSVQKQRHRALMTGSAGILMHPRMEGGHRRHGLDQQEDTQAKNTDAALGGAHQSSGRRLHHGREYGTAAAPLSTAFFVITRQ